MTAGVHLEFRLLGPLEACAGGQSIPLGGGKQRAVLSLLLLHAGELVRIEHLVEGLWGEEPPASAAHTIEGYVSRLRRVLGPDRATIVRRGGGYLLDLGGGAVDAHEADRLALEAAIALEEQQHGAAARLAAQALQLWRGPVLADVPLHGRGRVEADRLEELRVRMLETWGEAELALGRPEQVVAELRPLIASHPYRERLVSQLMVRSAAAAGTSRPSSSTSACGGHSTRNSGCGQARSSSGCRPRSCGRTSGSLIRRPLQEQCRQSARCGHAAGCRSWLLRSCSPLQPPRRSRW